MTKQLYDCLWQNIVRIYTRDYETMVDFHYIEKNRDCYNIFNDFILKQTNLNYCGACKNSKIQLDSNRAF